ncbi:TIGR02680 family protein [Nocardiopsis dassonvillei]|uniref:TIGR02680 family protein n=1 Tax=Nocardiopsis dassonvillei TaxID=2014 RepID=UPI000B9D6739|nr:TIGR02680 family protein [Nocardiopsis dassonvillei]ASU59086.1 TIGR02680 family protein [Nocardiopsis dassonvillei]
MSPRSDRFRPSRAGVINVWDYVDEEFVFADGRLVLRGHNGSGKTKALEVLFPFILDGYTDARRLDPFSGQNRTMKSNLLYRGQDSEYGYVWMEFARTGPGEGTETVTLVIGLRAHRHRDGVTPSFFVTDQRLGVDFGLLATDGRPLTERQLKGVLGEDAFRSTAADYRRAVDARLFGLGERYVQLLDLLLALRRPLLAKDLDPEKVSETLTSGLSPLDEELLDQAARDFTNLAAVQRRFDQASTAHAATTAFVGEYAAYLTAHARHRLARVHTAAGQTAEQARAIAEARDTRERATLAHAAATGRAEEHDARIRRLAARRGGLEAHEAFRSHAALEIERAHSAETARALAEQRARLDDQAGEVTALQREADRVAADLEHGRARTGELAAELAENAAQAGLDHDGEGPADTGDDLSATARARATARRADVAAVRERLAELARAETARGAAERAFAQAEDRLGRGEAECARAADDLAAARAGAADALTAWAAHWVEGPAPVTDAACVAALTEALEGVGRPGTPTVSEVYGEHTDQQRLDAAAHTRTLETDRDRLGAEIDRLTRERADIAAERDDAPPADALRTASREGRPGAPLWQLVRFADAVGDDEAAAVEGALYGAGLLTAWVHPDADATRAALASGGADAYLLPAEGAAAPEGPTLADVLVPERQDRVPEHVIARVLASVRLVRDSEGSAGAADTVQSLGAAGAGGAADATGAGGAAVHTVGTGARFAQGMLVGVSPKAAPEFIGATNRAHRRRERLAECDARIAELDERRARVAEQLDRAGELLKAFTRARAALPETATIDRAVRRVDQQSTLLASARAESEERRRDLDAAVAEVDAHRHQVRAVAAERAMPAQPEAVDAVARAVDDFLETARRLHTARAEVDRHTVDLDGRKETLDRLRARLEEDRERHEERTREHERAAAELAAKQEGIDAPVRELMAELEQVKEELHRVREEHQGAQKEAAAAHEAMIRADEKLEGGQRALTDSLAALFEQADAFAALTHPDLRATLGVDTAHAWPDRRSWPAPQEAAEQVLAAAPDDPETAVRAVLPGRAAELIDAFTAAVGSGAAVTDGDLKSVSTRISNALRAFQDTLGGDAEGYRVDHELGVSGVITVFVNDETGRNPVSAFARVIAERVEEQGALLREEERGVLEDELLTGIAQQIHERVRVARDLVVSMDRDTRSRPMSSGTRIGIRWSRSDRVTEHQATAARLVRRDTDELGASGLTRLREVLREMIREHHAAHPRTTYKQVLSAVLDYRTWYRFELRLAVPGQEEVKLTRNKHEQMSGGEKSAAIHLPLFAAANALYTSAAPTCPRMVALDEAFAGIDDRYKPELMGLTVTFDLDMFMTGHDLWVHYDSVPMAAHYDMHHDKGAHTVSAMLMLWDGAQTIDADAGFSGNEELAAQLLGITPSRFAPLSSAGTLLEDADA